MVGATRWVALYGGNCKDDFPDFEPCLNPHSSVHEYEHHTPHQRPISTVPTRIINVSVESTARRSLVSKLYMPT